MGGRTTKRWPDLWSLARLTVLTLCDAASGSAPAQEFRNTPPETGVGGDAFRAPEALLNLVPVRCAKVRYLCLTGHLRKLRLTLA